MNVVMAGTLFFLFVSKQDQQNDKEVVKYEKKLLCDGTQHPTESLREKCFQIKVSAPC